MPKQPSSLGGHEFGYVFLLQFFATPFQDGEGGSHGLHVEGDP